MASSMTTPASLPLAPHSTELTPIERNYQGKPGSIVTYRGYPLVPKATGEEGKSTTNRLESRICSQCLELATPPLMICAQESHQMCSPCFDKYKASRRNISKCPYGCLLKESPTHLDLTERELSNIKMRCPHHIDCKESVTINEIRAHTETAQKRQAQADLITNIKPPYSEMLFLQYWKENFILGDPPKESGNHLDRCPYRPVSCRCCDQVMPFNIYNQHHKTDGQCTSGQNCSHCDSGYFKGEQLPHDLHCLPQTLEQAANSGSQPPERQKQLYLASAQVMRESRDQLWRQLLGFTQISNNHSMLEERAGNIDALMQKMSLELQQQQLRQEQVQHSFQAIQALSTELKAARKSEQELQQTLASERARLKRLAEISAPVLFESTRKAMQAALKQSKPSPQPVHHKIGDIRENLKATRLPALYRADGDVNYFWQEQGEIIIHVINSEALSAQPDQNTMTWLDSTAMNLQTFLYQNANGEIVVGIRWLASDHSPAGAGVSAELEFEVFSPLPSQCFLCRFKFAPNNERFHIHHDSQSSQDCTLATIPAAPPEAAGATSELSASGQLIVRLKVIRGGRTGASPQPRQSKSGSRKK